MKTLRRWWQRLWRRGSYERLSLREFVYLDETSVYSLLASHGPLAEEFTTIEATSVGDRYDSSIALGAGPAKARLGSAGESTHTSSSQVVSRSTVQSAFKELMDRERDSLVLRQAGADLEQSVPQTLEQLETLAERGSRRAPLIDADLLGRGHLLEVDVELEAEAVFRVQALFASMLEMLDEAPGLIPIDRSGLEQATILNRVLNRLLVGLIPLRGVAVDYEVLETDTKAWIVDKRLTAQLPGGPGARTYPLVLVGLAEQGLFWKDVRRVLFSGSRYTVMCRLGRGGLQRAWTPFKLVELLEGPAPDAARQLEEARSGLVTMLSDGASDLETKGPSQAEKMKTALVSYAAELAEHHGKTCTEADLEADGFPTAAQLEAHATIHGRRGAFREITEHLTRTLDFQASDEDSVRLREESIERAGLSGEQTGTSQDLAPTAEQAGERYLDTEIVAIYW